MNVLSLFDGMSCGQIALDRLGVRVDQYFAAAIAATNGKARIHGLDKQVVSNDPDNPMPAIIKVEVVHK